MNDWTKLSASSTVDSPYKPYSDGGKPRKIFWMLVLSAGCIYSGYMIQNNAQRYFAYPSIIKPIFRQDDHVSFPKGTSPFFFQNFFCPSIFAHTFISP